MRNRLAGVALVVGLGCGTSAAASTPDWVAGQWIGGFASREGTTYVSVQFQEQDGALTGLIDLPVRGDLDLPLHRVRVGDHTLSFEIRGAGTSLLFDGRRRDDGRVRGSVRQAHNSTHFELIKVAPLSPERMNAIAGNYEIAPGHVVLVARGPSGLVYLDEREHRFGALYAVDDRTLVAGPSIAAGYPVELTITAPPPAGDAPVGQITWAARGRAAVTAPRRVFYRQEPVGYYNRALRLSATLVVPNTPGPHPAVVMVHGSGPATRDSLRPWADVYARAGIAVLISDKRGTGASMGSWSQATFEDLAGDALAGLAYLQSRPEIDPRRIGLHGMSLGGWVAPLAARRSPDVAFIIAESAPALTPVEHERLRVEHQLRADGFDRAAIARALAFMDQKFEVARTGVGWDALSAAMTRANAEGWLSYVNPPASLESLQWHWTHVLSYDPLPALEQITCPILVLYGALDSIVPASVHRERMASALGRAKTRDVTIKVFDRANHAFLEAVTGGRRENPGLRGFVAGYLGAHVDWLNARLPQAAGGDAAAPTEALQGPAEPPVSFVPTAPVMPSLPGAPALPSASRFFPPSTP